MPQKYNNRQTWGSQLGVPYKFFLCNPHNDTVVKRMLKEADEYKDMIYFDHIDDSYKNITYITHNMFLYAARQPGLHGAYFYKVYTRYTLGIYVVGLDHHNYFIITGGRQYLCPHCPFS